MAGSVNKVILIGNLGADPEVKSFQNGGRVANLRIATSETWKDKNTGERQEKTEWHTVAIFGDGLVGVAERFLTKGSKVYLEGKLATRKWADAQGNDRYSTEVVLQGPGAVMTMLDGPQNGSAEQSGSTRSVGGAGNSFANSRRAGSRSNAGNAGGFDDDLDDDIPFARNDTVW